MDRYKIIIVFFTALALVNLIGCKSSGVNSSGFHSVTEDNRTLKKVSNLAVKDFLKYDGCTSKLITKIVGAIPNNSSNKASSTFEHWIVQGCDKTYNFKLEFANDGHSVGVSEYEL